VQVYAALDAQVSLSCVSEYPVGPDCTIWGSGKTATSDFLDTAVMTGIALVDSNGNPISDFSVTSESGTVYTANGVVSCAGAVCELFPLCWQLY
jgi:hypothetical protein